MRKQRKRHKLNADINVVPYIDVMMVLLVIFMVTAPLLTQGVNVDLPDARSDPIDNEQNLTPLVVSVTQTGAFYLDLGENDSQAVSLVTIGQQVEKILARAPSTPVLIRGDEAIDYGTVVKLMTTLQKAGAASVGLVSETP